MPLLSEQQQTDNLREFFAAGVNSVTRERIFFSRLSFDLKIAAARAGYHLHLYEPDVDRDGFDIVIEDQNDGMGWFQLKAALRSAGTSKWSTTVGYIRPHLNIGEQFGFDPVECGRGGGVILIEIDDTNPKGEVVYSYTDFRIMAALAERYLVEQKPKGRGRPPTTRQAAAGSVIAKVRSGTRAEELELPRAAFIQLKSPDGLLAVMGLQTSEDLGVFAIQQAYRRVSIDAHGVGQIDGDDSIQTFGVLSYHMKALARLLTGKPDLQPFTFKSPYVSSAQSIL